MKKLLVLLGCLFLINTVVTPKPWRDCKYADERMGDDERPDVYYECDKGWFGNFTRYTFVCPQGLHFCPCLLICDFPENIAERVNR